MKLSTKARYAIMAMTDMLTLNTSEPISLASIAERQALPLPYLEQIFAKLRKNGLVKSARGSSGGYILAREASIITIFDIVVSVDKKLKTTRCQDHSPIGCQPDGVRCLTHHLWSKIDDVMEMFLKNVTLNDVVDDSFRRRPPSFFIEGHAHAA